MFKKNWKIATALGLLFLGGAPCAYPQPYKEATQDALLQTWQDKAAKSALGYSLLEVLRRCNQNLKRNPFDKQSAYQRGSLFGTIGCTTWAIHDLTKAIEVDPGYAAAYTERGLCYFDMRNYSRALADLDAAVYLDGASGDAHYVRGLILLKIDKPEAALADFSACEVRRLTPALPGQLPGNFFDAPKYYLGLCNEYMGRKDAALRYYKAYMEASKRDGTSGWLHRYADQPTDVPKRIASYESALNIDDWQIPR